MGSRSPGPECRIVRAPEGSPKGGEDQSQAPAADAGSDPSERQGMTFESALFDRLWRAVSQDEDPDGPINTDRPTFTPANTVVPVGRLQFESGFTFDYQQTSKTRTTAYDFPELAMRLGLADRVEFRTFWFGQTYSQTQSRPGGHWASLNGPSDMEIGFKWQLIKGNEDNKWIPTTALITSVYVPTGGTSPYSSETVDPYINLIYGWTPTKKLTVGGSTGIWEDASISLHGPVDAATASSDTTNRSSRSIRWRNEPRFSTSGIS